MNRKKLFKIVVPIAIVLAVALIWFLKNAESQQPAPVADDDSDFALHAAGPIDLEQLKSYGLPIIIDFGADACAPCKEMAPVLEELNRDLRGRAIIKFVDVWKNPEYAQGYRISAIPTQFFFDANGKPFDPQSPIGLRLYRYANEEGEHILTAHVGGMTKEQLLSVLEEMGME